jgi:hypothetical protein
MFNREVIALYKSDFGGLEVSSNHHFGFEAALRI